MPEPLATDVKAEPGRRPRILLIDNDADLGQLVTAIFSDNGAEVTVLADMRHDEIAAAVGRLEPDCILLDGATPLDYGSSWAESAQLAERERPIPVIMFSAHAGDTAEARAGTSDRSQQARFAAIVSKPFEIDELIATVRQVLAHVVPFDESPAGDAKRTQLLAEDVRKAGGSDVHSSTRREWVTFRTPTGRFMQVYWWQLLGAYLVGRYDEDGRRLDNIALTYTRSSAVEVCASLMRMETATVR